MTGAILELGTLVLPGASATEARDVAAAFHREIARLWEDDRGAGIAWADHLGDLVLEVEPGLCDADLGQAIARQVRDRARRGEHREARA